MDLNSIFGTIRTEDLDKVCPTRVSPNTQKCLLFLPLSHTPSRAGPRGSSSPRRTTVSSTLPYSLRGQWRRRRRERWVGCVFFREPLRACARMHPRPGETAGPWKNMLGAWSLTMNFAATNNARSVGEPETKYVTENVPVQTYQTVIENQVRAPNFCVPSPPTCVAASALRTHGLHYTLMRPARCDQDSGASLVPGGCSLLEKADCFFDIPLLSSHERRPTMSSTRSPSRFPASSWRTTRSPTR
jgi:hypothetical protein